MRGATTPLAKDQHPYLKARRHAVFTDTLASFRAAFQDVMDLASESDPTNVMWFMRMGSPNGSHVFFVTKTLHMGSFMLSNGTWQVKQASSPLK